MKYPEEEVFFNDFTDEYQLKAWYDMVLKLLLRYLGRFIKKFWYFFCNFVHILDKYGLKYVNDWIFETWNEPDLKMYNAIPFTYSGKMNLFI